MRVLLIYPDLHIHVSFPLGLGIISSMLKRDGHETKILHFNEEIDSPFDNLVLEQNMIDFEPQLIAFSSTSNQFRYVKQMASFIKKKWDIPIIVGGIHATIASEKILQLGIIDIICRGEGELAILELMDKLENGQDYKTIRNIGFKKNGEIIINPLRPLIDTDIFDALPFPDRKGFKFRKIIEKKHGWANVMASRGCLNNCAYCVNHYYHKIYAPFHKPAENLRYRKVDTIIQEIKDLLKNYPEITLINLDDDNITLNKKWLINFCEEYTEKIGLPFACNVHPKTFDQKIAKILAQSGCVEVKMGIESGSDRLIRDILRRPSNEDIIKKAYAAAEEAGLRAWSFNMIGIPTETKEEMLMTAKLNAKIRPYIVRCSIFYPYEGTDLYQYALEKNLIHADRADNVSSHLEDSLLEMPQLPREEIIKFKTMFKWYVDANSDTEAAPLFQYLISLFEKFPKEAWLSGKAKALFLHMDQAVDMFLKELKMEHYTTRRHLDLNFTKKLNFELP